MMLRFSTRALPRLRAAVQAAFVALTAVIAVQFAIFVRQVLDGGPVTVSRPAGVEAYLPLGALIGVRRWLETGYWDEIHPAGMTFFLAAIASAVVARRAFCSWVCPFGAISRALEWLRGRALRLPDRWPGRPWTRMPFEALKYLLLAQVLWTFGTLPLSAVNGFMYLPYNLAADANMLAYATHVGATGALVLGGLVLLTIVVRNGWCRVLCPYGALLGVAGAASPFRIVRDPAACRACGSCTKACGVGIRVAEAKAVHSLECTSCLSCVAACRVDGALGVRAAWGARVRPWIVPALALAVLAAFYVVARATGFWESVMTLGDYAEAYRTGLKPR